MTSLARVLLLLVSLALAAPAAYARHPHHGNSSGNPDRTYEAGVFDFYVLSLSWSPTFCQTHRSSSECAKGYGFVLHGLWPQFAKGGWPENCYTPERLTAESVQFAQTVYPASNLIDHEWSKHGSCSGLSSMGYFKLSDQAHTMIRLPADLGTPAQTHSAPARAIASSIQAANPGMPGDGVVVGCSGRDMAEILVCLSKDLKFMACTPSVGSKCSSGPIRIPGSQ